MADSTYQPKVYRRQGGDVLVVANGGEINMEPGGKISSDGAVLDITGSRGGNAALASVLTALETLGLITDSTSA